MKNIFLLIFLLLFPAGNGQAQSSEENIIPLINNSYFDANLREALSDTGVQAGITIVVGADVQGYVTCDFVDTPLDKALNILLAGTDYVVHKTPDYYLVSSPSPDSPAFMQISESRFIRLNYLEPKAAKSMFPKIYQSYIEPNENMHALCVTAPPYILEKILALLKSIDVQPKQLVLDTRVVVMENGDLQNLGLRWTWPQVKAGAYINNETKPQWPWVVTAGYAPDDEATNALMIELNLLNQNNSATILSSPRVMAQDGETAEVKISTEEYFKILTDAYYNRSSLEKVQSGIVLKMTPRIGDNGDISMEIKSEVSNVIARGVDNLPVVTRRVTDTTVRIFDGGTVAISGLMDSRSNMREDSTPFLSSIPVAGKLFSNNDSAKTIRQIAVFITPRLVGEDIEDSSAQVKREIPQVDEKKFKAELQNALNSFNDLKNE